VLSIGITNAIVEYLSEQEEFKIFVREAHLALQYVDLNKDQLEFIDHERIKLPFPLNVDFSAKVAPAKKVITPCQNCQYLRTINDTLYFELEEGERLVSLPIANSDLSLVFYEKIDSERLRDNLNQDFQEFDDGPLIMFSLITITCTFIGLTIYWPIKKLQSQIRELINAHNSFANGNLNMRANSTIQKPLDELALSFNQMASSISNSVKERSIFAQAIPHEVRTPLSRIQLASGLLRKLSEKNESIALLDDVDRYISDINELTSQIVEYSKIKDYREEDYSHYQTIDIAAFIKARLKMLTTAESIEVSISGDKTELTTNPVYLRLLVDNLIKNAINYSHSQILISIEDSQNELSIIIEDDGQGISIADRETILLPFARLDKSRSRQTGGLGLGLAIASAAVQKMSGTLSIEDAKLGGARFKFSIKNSS